MKDFIFLNLVFQKTKKITDGTIWNTKTSFCVLKKPINDKLVNQKNKFININKYIFHGSNTDVICKEKYRLPTNDRCHFLYLGLDIYSEMWVDSILNPKETNN